MERSDQRRGAKAGANSGRETTEEEKLHGESKDEREEGNGLYRTGRWSTFRFFLFSRSFFNHLSATLSPHRPRTLLNCLPLVFTPVPLRYGLSSEEALRDIYSAARVAWIKTGRNQQDERKKEERKKKKKGNKRNVWARILRTSRDTGHNLIDQVDSRVRYPRASPSLSLIRDRTYVPRFIRRMYERGQNERGRATANHEQTVLTSVTFEFVTKCLI